MAALLTVLVDILLAVLLLALAGTAYQVIGAALDGRRYPPPGRLVRVDGHRLHLETAGEGTPAVVLDSGLPGTVLSWKFVQSEVARLTRVCSYDRAGLGWSDAGPMPRTSRQIVEELRTLLRNAGIPGPYVLVGHSFGSFTARLYAGLYPDEVAGGVIVDPIHTNE
jgi:pimeloyl-ACP methyl ester carboxylesterase